jgi:diadenosine tetraphosphatase ApaH/serine/threonine PP2A family protein phosphatase
MRIAVMSDIHANLAALEAVLADAGQVDSVWNTGDAVGYGPQPRECIARLREAGAVWVAGNHERAATGAISTDDFNPAAALAAQWTGAQLTGEEKEFLDALPEIALQGDFTLCHGTLRDPIWEYLDDGDAALAQLALQRTPFAIVGHTHVPALVREMSGTYQIDDLGDGEVVALTGGPRLVLNAGSVGQPRDGDKRASYGIYDSEAATFTLRRVEYDIALTQKLMVGAGLPGWLIERLAVGR